MKKKALEEVGSEKAEHEKTENLGLGLGDAGENASSGSVNEVEPEAKKKGHPTEANQTVLHEHMSFGVL